MIKLGDKVLVSTDSWFFAPDGRQYRAVYGRVTQVSDSKVTLGIQTNSRSTNWYIMVGNILIAGCQVHYVIKTDDCNTSDFRNFEVKDGEVKHFWQPTSIYSAD